jgi:hypothetical protein
MAPMFPNVPQTTFNRCAVNKGHFTVKTGASGVDHMYVYYIMSIGLIQSLQQWRQSQMAERFPYMTFNHLAVNMRHFSVEISRKHVYLLNDLFELV